MKRFDDEIGKALKEEIVLNKENKEAAWKNINKGINREKRKGTNSYKLIAIAAILLIAISSALNTKVGYALITQIKDYFVPEKVVEQVIEGYIEENTLTSNILESNNYVIYIDEERYELVQGEDSDMIKPKGWDDSLPEVSMEIRQVVDKKPEEVIAEIYDSIDGNFDMSDPEKISEPTDGFRIYSRNVDSWDSPVIVVYVTSNKVHGSYVIIQKYFLEATEGHGTRFDNLLKEFYVIDASK